MQRERQFLEWVRGASADGPRRREVRLGIGDDAAVVRPGRGQELVITTDLMVEDVHFLRARDSAASCGRRLATRALSDLAAMGAEPLALLVSCAWPPRLPTAWARGFYRGLLAAGAEAGASLAGGDLAASAGMAVREAKILMDVVGLGQLPAGTALRRTGARPGDRLYISGMPGLAALGRSLVHDEVHPNNAELRQAARRHRHPRARWELGRALRGIASAALDLSDGLSVDLGHLCAASSVGAEVDAERLPRPSGPTGLDLALHGGEDYELLFTVPQRRTRALLALGSQFPLTEIGRITAECTIRLRTGKRVLKLAAGGWQHFAQKTRAR